MRGEGAETEALENLGVTLEKIVQPLIDGLAANVVVKHSESLAAKVTDVPDLEMRGRTIDRIVNLYGFGAKHSDHAPAEPAEASQPRDIKIVFVAPPNRDPQPPPCRRSALSSPGLAEPSRPLPKGPFAVGVTHILLAYER